MEVIARLLGDHSISESERAEAAGVLAQVTSPWIEDNDYVLGVTENAFNLVKKLTPLCSNVTRPSSWAQPPWPTSRSCPR